MGLKQAILEGMEVKQLRRAVRQLDVPVERYREKQSLATGVGKSRRANVEVLVEFLSEKEVKRLCDRRASRLHGSAAGVENAAVGVNRYGVRSGGQCG